MNKLNDGKPAATAASKSCGTLMIGKSHVQTDIKKATGQFIQIDGEKYYEIKNFDAMQPFFISLASDSNHWMYISSSGGLTAGRKNPDMALFPYYTDDKISESAEITGSKTIIRVCMDGNLYLWEPFSDRYQGIYNTERSIAKSTTGNKLIFTEKNTDLGLTFSYSWMNSDKFGWVKKSRITNVNNFDIEVNLIDGLQNILPSGVDRQTQNTYSTLVDGYKKTELIEDAALALFRMEAILVDRPEPSESLRCNTAWCYGLPEARFLLSSTQLNNFRKGDNTFPETEAKGVRAAFFACTDLQLHPGATQEWYFIAEVHQDSTAVNNLIDYIQTSKDIKSELEQDIAKGTENLIKIVAQADGIQHTGDENGMARHFANVLFNTMRGGIYNDNYNINGRFFAQHVKHFNRKIGEQHNEFLLSIPDITDYRALEKLIQNQNDNNLYRLFQEYLPLTFSRRHGDPSRPWNLFNINIRDEAGNQLLSYQGNWRDIFQNWEALSISYPLYINGIISKFLNATTADGYNPYRVTNEGIDWEVIEPDNPWSNIGYWGDHQIIYLLKLMELSRSHNPDSLASWLDKELFAYANVPYRIKNYEEIVDDPKNSIRFDQVQHHKTEQLEKTYGADARLILNNNGEVKLVNLTEKLLATLLAKLSNFIPDAGIWMNTLRPEWNDANNALVGTGASMVTLCYMRRFVTFTRQLFSNAQTVSIAVSKEIFDFFENVFAALIDNASNLEKGFTDQQRRTVTDELGRAGSNFRHSVYEGFSNQKAYISASDIINFLNITLDYLDRSIENNKRADNMYHAYNIVSFGENEVTIRHLYEMLEGQVAVLSSGKLSASEANDVLNALSMSELYRADQNSYILYPNKKLPSFLKKNEISSEEVMRISLLKELISKGDSRIITQDKKGKFHFNAAFNNVGFLNQALGNPDFKAEFKPTGDDITAIKNLYEKIFDHQSFTGRSGTFYKYEGLGCIYWHMVSKLLLAIGENIERAIDDSAGNEIVEALKQHYREVKAGIGAHKSPGEYGSFPFDPYSHTPLMAGVQQPGMTGQVKEDIISRYFELGIHVEKGCIHFSPAMVNREEFSKPDESHSYPNLRFTYCSVPIEYQIDGKKGTDIIYKNGTTEQLNGTVLNFVQSQQVFGRSKEIQKIMLHFT